MNKSVNFSTVAFFVLCFSFNFGCKTIHRQISDRFFDIRLCEKMTIEALGSNFFKCVRTNDDISKCQKPFQDLYERCTMCKENRRVGSDNRMVAHNELVEIYKTFKYNMENPETVSEYKTALAYSNILKQTNANFPNLETFQHRLENISIKKIERLENAKREKARLARDRKLKEEIEHAERIRIAITARNERLEKLQNAGTKVENLKQHKEQEIKIFRKQSITGTIGIGNNDAGDYFYVEDTASQQYRIAYVSEIKEDASKDLQKAANIKLFMQIDGTVKNFGDGRMHFLTEEPLTYKSLKKVATNAKNKPSEKTMAEASHNSGKDRNVDNNVLTHMDGFRGIRWGTHLSHIKDKVFVERNYPYVLITKTTENLTLGNAKLSNVYYIFRDKGFVSVFIEAKGKDNFSVIKNMIDHEYGYGQQTETSEYIQYIWHPNTCNLRLEFSIFSNVTRLIISSQSFIEDNVFTELSKNFSENTGPRNVDGFRGIKWGTNINSLEGMKEWGPVEDFIYFTKSNDKLRIGGARLNKILYMFWNNLLAGVVIGTTGTKDFSAIKDAAFKKFGKDCRIEKSTIKRLGGGIDFVNNYIWGDHTLPTYITLRYSAYYEQATLTILGTNVIKQMQKWKENNIKKGANDF